VDPILDPHVPHRDKSRVGKRKKMRLFRPLAGDDWIAASRLFGGCFAIGQPPGCRSKPAQGAGRIATGAAQRTLNGHQPLDIYGKKKLRGMNGLGLLTLGLPWARWWRSGATCLIDNLNLDSGRVLRVLANIFHATAGIAGVPSLSVLNYLLVIIEPLVNKLPEQRLVKKFRRRSGHAGIDKPLAHHRTEHLPALPAVRLRWGGSAAVAASPPHPHHIENVRASCRMLRASRAQ